jgi:hypothetical protein
MMLYRKNDAVLDFDLAKVIEQSRDNPVFLRAVRPRPGVFDLSQRARGRVELEGPAPRSFPSCLRMTRPCEIPRRCSARIAR